MSALFLVKIVCISLMIRCIQLGPLIKNWTAFLNGIRLDASKNSIIWLYNIDSGKVINTTHLNLSINSIKIITRLKELPNLTELDLSWNQIDKVDELNSLSKLEVLNISYNSLLHLKNMTGLLKLKILVAKNNRIYSISGLRTLVSLSILDL